MTDVEARFVTDTAMGPKDVRATVLSKDEERRRRRPQAAGAR